jgi:ferritin-like metal-binding protein YciE
MFSKMKLDNLKSLYVAELKDAYDFENRILEALPKMVDTAEDVGLKRALEQHGTETRGQVSRLERIFDELGQKPERKTCKGMKGLLDEADDMLEAKGDADTRDAAIISAAQRVEHYEMAVYGSLRTYAQVLGYHTQANLLEASLREEEAADAKLTDIAVSGINAEAAVGATVRSRI